MFGVYMCAYVRKRQQIQALRKKIWLKRMGGYSYDPLIKCLIWGVTNSFWFSFVNILDAGTRFR